MKMTKLLLSGVALGALAATASATPVRMDGPEQNLQQIIDALPGGGGGIDVQTDQLAHDERFAITGFTGSAYLHIELAGYANFNSFGIYDIYNSKNRIEVFDGPSGAGAAALFAPSGFGTDLFGFYLNTPDGTWFSQSTRNSDGADHMVGYERGGQLIFGWEDLSNTSWDQDYNDFVVLVSGIEGVSVPEPASLGLLGLGLAGIGVFRRKKQDKSVR